MSRSRLAFSLTRMSPVVGFGYGRQTELQAGAARSAFHFGNLAQHLLDVADHAVGFRQRTARGHEVVEDESAFVHFRQQVGTGKVVANIGNDDQCQR